LLTYGSCETRRRPLIVLALLACLLFGLRHGSAGDISYVYDALGRLVAVIDPASDTATYQYDAVGNLLGITSQSSAVVSVIGFAPSAGHEFAGILRGPARRRRGRHPIHRTHHEGFWRN
jgi:YD repeat-containing protein